MKAKRGRVVAVQSVPSPVFPPPTLRLKMLINNLSSRLRLSSLPATTRREAERQRVKAATKALRTHAEKMAWHLADMASAVPIPVPVQVIPSRSRR